MKVKGTKESIELCTEAGWYAYDITTDSPIDKGMIQRLGELGTMTYLGMLSQPFYRIETAYYMIKGLQGESQLRAAMLGGREEILQAIYKVLEESDTCNGDVPNK